MAFDRNDVMSSETGRSADRHAEWMARQERHRAIQELVRTSTAAEIRSSPLVSLAESATATAPPAAAHAEVVAEAIYTACGARLGAVLVEPNVVLTLGGYRGQTECLIRRLRRGDLAVVSRADRAARRFGVRLRVERVRDYRRRPIIDIDVESLRGYAYTSAQSSIPGVPPFDTMGEWRGLGVWKRMLRSRLRRAQDAGHISRLVDVDHAWVGVLKGYPDAAILGYLEAYAVEVDEMTTINSDLPLARAYECGEPNYGYPPALASDPVIQAHRRLWNDALLEFYASPWHLRIRDDLAFRRARRTTYDV